MIATLTTPHFRCLDHVILCSCGFLPLTRSPSSPHPSPRQPVLYCFFSIGRALAETGQAALGTALRRSAPPRRKEAGLALARAQPHVKRARPAPYESPPSLAWLKNRPDTKNLQMAFSTTASKVSRGKTLSSINKYLTKEILLTPRKLHPHTCNYS